MWWLLIVCVVLALAFFVAVLNRVFQSPYHMAMIIGKPGSGKSTLMVKTILKCKKKGAVCYCNEPVIAQKLGINYISINDLAKSGINHCCLFIDEAGIDLDNRSYKTFSKELAAWFKLYRHNKIHIWLFSQTFDIDKKVRDLCDRFSILKQRLGVFCFERHIDIVIKLIQADGNSKEGYIVDDLEKRKLISGGLSIHFLPRWWRKFDSFDTSRLDDEKPPLKVVSVSADKLIKEVEKTEEEGEIEEETPA